MIFRLNFSEVLLQVSFLSFHYSTISSPQKWIPKDGLWGLWRDNHDFPRWCLCRWGSSQQWHLSSLASLSKSQRPEWHRPNPRTVDLMEALWHGWKQSLPTPRYDQKSTFDSWKGKMEEFTLYRNHLELTPVPSLHAKFWTPYEYLQDRSTRSLASSSQKSMDHQRIISWLAKSIHIFI